MRKALGLAALLATLVVLTSAWEYFRDGTLSLLSAENIRNQLTWVGLFGILSLGQSLVIITGGIDLSVGSVVALVGCSLAMLLDSGKGMDPALAIPIVLGLSVLIGVWHGFLVSKVRLQPFIVTLCGLFLYRGAARFMTGDRSQGFGGAYAGLRELGKGFVFENIPIPFLFLIGLAILVGAFLHLSPQGRHLFALGANEESARFSGVNTDRLKMAAYVLCSLLSGWAAILLAFKVPSIGSSDFGNFYELYAIAGAVLGGCSLRGGSGHILGIAIGASLIVLLRNIVVILGIPSQMEYVVIGSAILIGVGLDEVFSRKRQIRTRTS
ncbi:MAG: ABC transporter permease [Candidatus Hydrogenedentes bacterium]|nr:ABC transporter permease [Candidatus Hydrogenedentota bacterium]